VRRGDVIARLSRALELWHDGDPVAAVQVIEDLRDELEFRPIPARYRCDGCGQRFRWPGELDHHQRLSCRRLPRPVRRTTRREE
jgi:hypothetical protein